MKKALILVVTLALALAGLVGCGEETDSGQTIDSDVPLDDEYGKPLLGDESPSTGKGDSVSGARGLPVSVDDASTQVWDVSNAWLDTDTADARMAGIAWGEASGLTWEEKYRLWIGGMTKTASTGGYSDYETFTLNTPYGRTLPAPNLECAETALFLRALFASWHHLPFYVMAYSSGEGYIYFGHFGIRTAAGRWSNTPAFKSYAGDYENLSPAEYQASWPADTKLRGRKLSTNGDDENDFLGEGKYAGAYFDEILLNKRVGHFLIFLLSYTGSVHLASADNTFNLDPRAINEGDVLLERWQKKGIGHTLVVKSVDHLDSGQIDAELVSGSMPRRQPKWEDGAKSKSYFINNYCGGPGETSDGTPYAKLGGGLKRWRQPQVIDGYYYHMVPTGDRDDWIKDNDTDTLAGRIATFEGLLGQLSPEAKKAMLLETIEEKRLHLRNYPASCSARTAREEAFAALYALEAEEWGRSVTSVDKDYRILEDYVFAELEYEKSRTCCWNSTTPAMYEIIMEVNLGIVYDAQTQTCNPPEVFMVKAGGYPVFEAYAAQLGKSDLWVPWTADETCPQSGVANDTEKAHAWTPLCDIAADVMGEGGSTEHPTGCTDQFDGNSTATAAQAVGPGSVAALQICGGLSDWFVIEGDGTPWMVTITFENDAGDLDLKLYDGGQAEIASSASVGDTESVRLPAEAGTYYVEVQGYNGAENTYSVKID
ncbi:MAG: PPC domain-containing protein [Pseudomonadota bacterium]